MQSVIINKSDNKILAVYEGSPSLSRFGGKWADASQVMHLQVPEGANALELIYDGAELIEDASKIQAAYDSDMAAIKNTRSRLLALCDFTQVSDAPISAQDVSDWADYRQALRDLPSSVGVSSFIDMNLVTTSGQDDINLISNDPEDNQYTIVVLDPALADAGLEVSVSARKDITVVLATDSESLMISTLQEVVDAINAHKVASLMVTASVKAGATSTDVIDTPIAQTSFAGGSTIASAVWPTPPSTPVISGIND